MPAAIWHTTGVYLVKVTTPAGETSGRAVLTSR
jgi:hypothetical protein